MEASVKLNKEQIDELIRQYLIDDYAFLKALNETHPGRADPKDIKAIKRLIKYYSTEDQYKEWKSRGKV